jgi:secondary thiamine-phosphate synthase enzyme
MRQAIHTLQVPTGGRGLVEITGEVAGWVEAQAIATGLLTLFCRHTSASLLIQENADPRMRADLEAFFERIAPEEPAATATAPRGRTTCPPICARP